jgi:subtilisin family serine protease
LTNRLTNPHLDASLLRLIQPKAGAVAAGADSRLSVSDDLLTFDDAGRVGVQITARDVTGLQPSLRALGFRETAAHPELHFLEGYLPTASLLSAAGLAPQGLFGVMPIYRPVAGAVADQADFVHQTDRVRATVPPGVNGTGVKIGVLSDSYNFRGGAAADIASGDLPAAGVQVLQDSGTSDEGRAMLQLIHDLAPGSPLAFATANGGEGAFAQRIRDLADPALGNCQVIVDDVTYLAEPFFQDGIVAQAVDDVVTTRGVAYFSSAGNAASRAYESTTINFAPDAGLGSGSFFDFDPGPGVDTRQQITIPATSTFTLSFQWDQPFYTAGGVTTDLDIFVLVGGSLFGTATNNILNQRPAEIISITNNGGQGTADIVIRRNSGPNVGRLKYVNFGAVITVNEFATNSPTISPHAGSANAMAVAAAPYFNHRTFESFTSRGPTTILFSPTGTPLGSAQVRAKPDITAVDATNTTFFGSDIDSDGLPNFSGTSAAAPHAAAVAALVRQANPSFTPAQVYNRLITTADPNIGSTPGNTNIVGAGLIDAYRAVIGSPVAASLNFADGFESGVLSQSWETYTTVAGRNRVSGADAPASGSFHLLLDNAVGTMSLGLNEAILHVNAAGASNLMLSFQQKEFGDEDQAMPLTFPGHGNFDGVALSVDGVNWVRVVSLTGAASTTAYQTHPFNLSQIAAANGLTLGADTRIKFQHFDNFPINSADLGNSDGFAFDNISVTAQVPPAVTTEPANQTVIVGQTASFTAAASGTPTPTVQWQVSDNGGLSFSDIDGATATTLSFPAALADNAKLYRAVFTNAAGTATSNTATLLVNPITVNDPVTARWGTARSALLVTATDGLRLLPMGRNTTLPWVGLNRLDITLSHAAVLTSAHVSVSSAVGASYGPVTVTGSGTTYTIMLAQPITLMADRVTVTISNATIATYVRRLDVLPGDVFEDGVVDTRDFILVRNMVYGFGGTVATLFGDLNGDGLWTILDINIARARVGTVLPPLAG